MSHKTVTALGFLGLLTALNGGILLFNMAPPARATVAGMNYQALLKDPDFTRAVKAIIGQCKVNVDLGKLSC